MSGFVDECNINVKAGDGGAGCVAFRREAHVARGGPNGGDGGDGGNIWLVADRNVASLLAFRDHPHRTADAGKHGSGNNRHGARGGDVEVSVPVGTMVFDHTTSEQITDLAHDGDRWLAAAAGQGGRGNARFLTNKRRAPSFAEQTDPGEQRWLRLELKLLADVAIIGFPNVGKSTFISRVSAAKPKIADYPFTTLEPNLGVVSLGDREFVLADIPGLIEGAADGKGLGHEFLRHTERARVLVILLDPSELQQSSYQEQLSILLRELEAHSPDLVTRPYLVTLAKTDVLDDLDEPTAWARGAGIELYPVSSVTGEGLDDLMYALADEIDKHVREAPDREGFVLHRPLRASYSVAREDGVWVVSGRAADRAINLSDLTVPEAADYSAKRLAFLGVDAALEAAGAEAGDEVRIGSIVFTYSPADVS